MSDGDLHWHAKHADTLSVGDRVADAVAAFIGSWRFIIAQSGFFLAWIIVNLAWVASWLLGITPFDPYPFVFFNLIMSAEAAYTGPLVLMSQNRQQERDRHHAEEDYRVNREAEQRIEALQTDIARIENEKLDRIEKNQKKIMEHLGIQ